jgi:hypothetical protein
MSSLYSALLLPALLRMAIALCLQCTAREFPGR